MYVFVSKSNLDTHSFLYHSSYRYSTSLFGTTIVNIVLLKQGVAKSIAMWGTVFGFGLVNYFLLRHLMKRTPTSTTAVLGKKNQPVDTCSVRKSTLKQIRRGGNQVESFLHNCAVILKSFSSSNESLTIVPPHSF